MNWFAIPRYRGKGYILAILPCEHSRVYHSREWDGEWTLPCTPCQRYYHPLGAYVLAATWESK